MSVLVGMVLGWSLGVAIVWKVTSPAKPSGNGGHAEVAVCPPCAAHLGEELAREIGDCYRHTPAVQALARQLAEVFQHVDIDDEKVGWFIEDATEIASEWPHDKRVEVTDLGMLRDDRRHLLIGDERWAEPDPNAEGFNPLQLMTACTHPWLLPETDEEHWPFDDEDTPCELCLGTGWTSRTPEELAETAAHAASSPEPE